MNIDSQYFMPKQSIKFSRSQIGVTLIESVIALLIFSLGALGLAAMQLTSLSASGDSKQRSMVIWKAQEFIDRVKGNGALGAGYMTTLSNQTFNNIGVDTPTSRFNCTNFTRPAGAKFCADGQGANTASNCSDNQDKINYDIWDVFCNTESGLASTAAGGENRVGVTGLEVALKQNTFAANGNDDYLLAFEWLAREADNNTDIAAGQNFATSLCGEANRNIAANLDVYCVRFRP